MDVLPTRAPRDTGAMEIRDFGPTGRRLGTPDDCYDGSPWELHRGELWEQPGCRDIHGIVVPRLAALFRTHARLGMTAMIDVYCDLSDATGASVRAPDVVLVGGLQKPKGGFCRGTPILAVEVRGTQSKCYLDEKVKLYLEHAWPCTWIVHAEREEVEVIQPRAASVVYRRGGDVPLVPELDKYGLRALPVAAFFDGDETRRFNDGWVVSRMHVGAVISVLTARGFVVSDHVQERIHAESDTVVLDRWLALAATAPSVEAFAAGMNR